MNGEQLILIMVLIGCIVLGAVLITVGRSYVGNDVTHSTLLDRACAIARAACSYKNIPKYHSYHVNNTAPWSPDREKNASLPLHLVSKEAKMTKLVGRCGNRTIHSVTWFSVQHQSVSTRLTLLTLLPCGKKNVIMINKK